MKLKRHTWSMRHALLAFLHFYGIRTAFRCQTESSWAMSVVGMHSYLRLIHKSLFKQ